MTFDNHRYISKNIVVRTRVFYKSKFSNSLNTVGEKDKATKLISVNTNYNLVKSNSLPLNNRFASLQGLNENNDPTNNSHRSTSTKHWVQRGLDENQNGSLVSGSNPNKNYGNKPITSTDTRDTVSVVRTVLQGSGKAIMNKVKVNIHGLNDKCSGF